MAKVNNHEFHQLAQFFYSWLFVPFVVSLSAVGYCYPAFGVRKKYDKGGNVRWKHLAAQQMEVLDGEGNTNSVRVYKVPGRVGCIRGLYHPACNISYWFR